MNELPEIANNFLDHLYVKGRKKSTIKRYQYDYQDFFSWLNVQYPKQELTYSWNSLSIKEGKAFLDFLIQEKQYKVVTIRRIHSALRQLAVYTCSEKNLPHPFIVIEPPDSIEIPLSASEWVSKKEAEQLLFTIKNDYELSEAQIEVRPLLKARNEIIVLLFLRYGLTLQEVVQLKMKDMRFEKGEIYVYRNGEYRSISLTASDQQLAFRYYQNIPEAVRPRYHGEDPFFVAFDFQRKTYRWSYEDARPKNLTNIAIQKMIRVEAKRAMLRSGISAQHLRNRFILHSLLTGELSLINYQKLGFKSSLSFRRYTLTLENVTSNETKELQAKI
ncbi:putative integrase [Bacillus sp. TS-2]|nr:putative integrase [Bacillus sp. TS-2]